MPMPIRPDSNRFFDFKFCHKCNQPIDYGGKYLTGIINGKVIIKCLECWVEEKEVRDKIIDKLENECLTDLIEANRLSPTNKTIQKNLKNIKDVILQMKKSIQIS